MQNMEKSLVRHSNLAINGVKLQTVVVMAKEKNKLKILCCDSWQNKAPIYSKNILRPLYRQTMLDKTKNYKLGVSGEHKVEKCNTYTSCFADRYKHVIFT